MTHHKIPPERRRYVRALAIGGLAALAVLAPAGATAQPARDGATPATAGPVEVHRTDTPPSITFTNPLGRSRGPGAGAGLL